MKTVESFKTNRQGLSFIEIIVLNEEEKINYDIEQPSEALNQFDIAQALYHDTEHSIILTEERLGSLLHRLSGVAALNLAGYVQVDTHLIGKLSLWSDKLRYQKKSTIGLEALKNLRCSINKSVVWNSPGIHVMLYAVDNKYYLEISSYYGWTDGRYIKKIVSFEEYEKTYNPLVLAELSRKTLENWRKKCESLLKKIDCWYEN